MPRLRAVFSVSSKEKFSLLLRKEKVLINFIICMENKDKATINNAYSMLSFWRLS